MTYTEWDIEDDVLSPKNHYNCSLGINKETGRLQWCAGNKCIKMLIIVPATLLPVVLLLLLLTHLEVVGSTKHQRAASSVGYAVGKQNQRYMAVSNGLEASVEADGIDNEEQNDKQCMAIRYSMSETLDDEERDLLKDVRTSFIPSESVFVPPNCRRANTDWVSENRDELIDSSVRRTVGDYELEFPSYLYRRRKRAEALAAAQLDNQTKALNSDVVQRTDQWFILNEKRDDTSDSMSSPDTNIPTAVRAFWKGEGTPEQIRSTQADVMLQYMDTTADPCEDYYQYSCGNWEKLNPIPKDKAAYDTFEMLRENLDTVLEELLTENAAEPPAPKTDTNSASIGSTMPKDHIRDLSIDQEKLRLQQRILMKRSVLKSLLQRYKMSTRQRRHLWDLSDAEAKAKNMYKSCMNYELLEKRGVSPLLDLLDKLGGWPALSHDWNADHFDWLNLTAKLRLYNNDIFIVEWIGPDIKNSDKNIIQFDQTSLGLPTRDYFIQSSNAVYLEAYTEYMRTILTLLGVPKESAHQVSKEIVEFETELAKITSAPEERTNVTILYTKLTVAELHTSVPQIDWKRYLSIVQERPVNSSEIVIMFAMNYMKNLVLLLAKNDPKTIANYLIWRFVRHRVNNLDDRFQDAKQKFYFVLFGREQSPPRWKTCVNQVNANMGMAVGAMFVRKYFDENSKRDTLAMTYELQQSFRELLTTTSWLDEPTRHLAELKVNAMTLRIGYPDFILDRTELNEKYKDLSIHPNRYFENTLEVLMHLTRTEQLKLTEPVNKTTWHTAPAVVNAYYSRNKNQIMFPAGILQPPFYHRHFPRSLNYGGIGVVIGHELTHGFDDKGRLFDLDGNLQRWWSDAAVDGFHQRARCLVTQYSNYTVSEVSIAVDGENTQGENIADNGGIKQAFRAYKQWLSVNEDNEEVMSKEVLAGVNATNTQLFFLNFAQVWCGAMRPEAMRNKLKTAVHSPGRFRVIGTLSNSEDFAKEYECPLGSPMNPEHKCSVW